MFKYLIFDLDGTLINSEEGIKESLINSFKKAKIEILIPYQNIEIGPPLDETILLCNSGLNYEQLEKIKTFFREQYDFLYYKKLEVFNNVTLILDKFKRSKIEMFIATNKRYEPTLKIVNYLNWNKYFKNIYSIDRYYLETMSKTNMLKILLEKEKILARESLYIGDKYSDFIASSLNQISFIGANWGGSDFYKKVHDFKIIDKINEESVNSLSSLFIK
ncbi:MULTISPECIES: HAD family hydrolase [Prochlorococcus]|uniref:Phosphoglycolate phosphatasee n=1 Tax=Prochlorococcus marinus str. MIT 9314 TaxID=167548 RepID=A0A0A2AEK0_PROMR|nr:HAD hydrolase-like protein [Prochlorococcus marinus]KGG00308.1 Phosphoglycolate phosphatasee [Prochlorococcus marinus str. MIT 9314]